METEAALVVAVKAAETEAAANSAAATKMANSAAKIEKAKGHNDLAGIFFIFPLLLSKFNLFFKDILVIIGHSLLNNTLAG